jgi:hypothetical protein
MSEDIRKGKWVQWITLLENVLIQLNQKEIKRRFHIVESLKGEKELREVIIKLMNPLFI